MNKIRTIMLIAPVISLAGCEALYDPSVAMVQTPYNHLHVATSGEVLLSGSTIRTGEHLTSYTVGRYVDPADPNIMHESHVVYRKDGGSSWNLVSPPGSTMASPISSNPNPPGRSETTVNGENDPQVLAALLEQNELLEKQLANLQANDARTVTGPGTGSTNHE